MDAIAERPANTQAWHLALSFRAASDRLRGPSFRTLFPLEATSKTSLFIQAERITNEALSQVVAERLT